MDNAANALNKLASHCCKLGNRLVLENMLPHLFFGHARDVLWILGALESTEVGICLDTGHAYLSGDLENVAHKLSGHLWMIHASDNNGHYDDHLPPGQGKINWAALIDQLSRLHFSGTIILEIAGGQDSYSHPGGSPKSDDVSSKIGLRCSRAMVLIFSAASLGDMSLHQTPHFSKAFQSPCPTSNAP